MKRHPYACALGLLWLLMVVGAQNARAQQIEIHEAIAGGGTSNPAATTLIVISNFSGQASAGYSRTEYGTQPITTQGTLPACP